MRPRCSPRALPPGGDPGGVNFLRPMREAIPMRDRVQIDLSPFCSGVGRGAVDGLEWYGLTALDAYPVELASHASLPVDAQRAREALRADGRAALQGDGDAECVVTECEQPAAA